MNKLEIKEFVIAALERGDLDPDPVDRDMTDEEISYDCESKSYLLLCVGGNMYDAVLDILEAHLSALEYSSSNFHDSELYALTELLKKFIDLNHRCPF